MTDTTAQPWTDDEVERYARVIAAAGGDDKWIDGKVSDPEFDPNQLLEDYKGDARAVLAALHADGRLRTGDETARIAELEAALQRVRDLCARALADDGSDPVGGWEDPTPIPGWVAAVENAINGPGAR